VNRVDDLFKMVHFCGRALCEVSSLGMPPAYELVAVFNGAFLP